MADVDVIMTPTSSELSRITAAAAAAASASDAMNFSASTVGMTTTTPLPDQQQQQQPHLKRSFAPARRRSSLPVASSFKEVLVMAGYDDHDVDDDDDDDDHTSSETEDEYESEEETEIAQAMVKAAFSKTKSVTALDQFFKSTLKQQDQNSNSNIHRSGKRDRAELDYPKSASMPNMAKLKSAYKKKKVAATAAAASSLHPNQTTNNQTPSYAAAVKPDDYLRRLLLTSDPTKMGFVKYYPSSSLHDFFEPLDEDCIASYDLELVRAVREQDMDALRSMHNIGRLLHAGNKFGETILHAASRRGATDVVRFLLNTAEVPVKVCCDYGRTPCHDACWTAEPNFDVIGMLLDACPDFLYITDKRGFTPLSYAPPESYGQWYRFLDRRGADGLRPRELV